MTNFCVIDLETSISKGVHGSAAKDPNNDFFTVIVGIPGQNTLVLNKTEGFKRQIPAEAAKLLNNADVIIGHNLGFDISYIIKTEEFQAFMLRGGQIWDTQMAEYLLTGQRHCFSSLGELQLKYLNQRVKPSRISKIYSKGIGADKILAKKSSIPRLFKLYMNYCESDGQTPLQIFAAQYKLAEAYKMTKTIKMFNQYLLSLINVMNSGITVNIPKCERTLQDFKIKAVQYLHEATEIVRPMWDERLGEFNINSPKDKSAILFGGTYQIKVKAQDGYYKNGNPKFILKPEKVTIQGFGVPTFLSTQGKIAGQWATGADVLAKIATMSKNPTLHQYCELQKLAMTYHKMCSTYLEPFLNLSVDGLLYPKYNTCLTITSRLSSSEPNLQNVPSKGEMIEHIQGQLTGPEGWTCVSIDYSQLEIWVVAYLSRDPNLMKDLTNGVDFHIKRLGYATGMNYEQLYDLCKVQKLPEWELKRSYAKTVSYQKAYGAGVKKLAKHTGLTEQEIQTIFDKEDVEYSGVKRFNDHVLQQVEMSKEPSRELDIPAALKRPGKNSKRFRGPFELLPIIQENNEVMFKEDVFRNVGYYQTHTGKRYAFEELGLIRHGRMRIGFSPTQTKNYQIQGTASDIQASSTAALLPFLLKNQDKVRMINEIHDSKWFIIKNEHLDELLPVIREIMENIPKHFKEFLGIEMPFRIPVDIKIGPNFADMEAYSDEI